MSILIAVRLDTACYAGLSLTHTAPDLDTAAVGLEALVVTAGALVELYLAIELVVDVVSLVGLSYLFIGCVILSNRANYHRRSYDHNSGPYCLVESFSRS